MNINSSIKTTAAPQMGECPQMGIDIFCKVIDNYGDAGVCLHLARTLTTLQYQVRLFCDHMEVLSAIATPADWANEHLQLSPWAEPASYLPAPVVICAFGCALDEALTDVIQHNAAPVCIINLEYLSAENWVEGCHTLTSPVDSTTRYFFFPGFTAKTGGLNVDPRFKAQCQETLTHLHAALAPQQLQEQEQTTQQEPQTATATATAAVRTMTLFGYHNPALLPLLQSLQRDSLPTQITVFTGLALDNLNELLHLQLKEWDTQREGQVTFKVSGMVDQDRYDQLLLQHDFNLVRGEDSIVRAMHTGHPFLWQIYPQEENAHIIKLQSFLTRMREINLECQELLAASEPASEPEAESDSDSASMSKSKQPPQGYIPLTQEEVTAGMAEIEAVMLAYNEAQEWPQDFNCAAFVARTAPLYWNLAAYLCLQPTLAERLDEFIRHQQGTL